MKHPAYLPFHIRGQALSEYLIAATLLLALLVGSRHGGDEDSPVGRFLSATAEAFERFSHFLSLPL